ncbi:DnaB-like helicase C-terminal domain-containing protein [Pedococcus sp. 5OH_020]|uniref:DnaB-like helicase C-terminal domain-containing protein n=1 Tax=Pedococcus sp. 5OH_020 TaxID=2989814 RepID=UPI0022E9FD00|nr:DnaB-like helicase C-terminal domain-containing protein [Pedococcus sp. 5OH_020]
MASLESVAPASWPSQAQSTSDEPATGRRGSRLHSLSEVLEETDEQLRLGRTAGARVFPSGFGALDMALSGGFRSGELVLLGGPQGLGKTAMALQMMRNAVAARRAAVLFSFEHDSHSVLERLIAVEAAAIAGTEAVNLTKIRQGFEARHSKAHSLSERFSGTVGGAEAVAALAGYGDRLHLHTSSGAKTTLEEIHRTVRALIERDGTPPLVVVDYLQKVPVSQPTAGEDDRVTVVVEGLKDLALECEVPVLAIVAAEKGSLAPGTRMRVHDLRGSSALAYEADVVLILNDKYDVVAKHHLVYNLGNAERYRQWVVMSIEKNRSGADHLELEFQKRFDQGRFEPEGRIVQEQLVEERVFRE